MVLHRTKRRSVGSSPGTGRASGPAQGVALVATLLILAGCAGTVGHQPQSVARSLTPAEMDGITVGDARATSDSTANALGEASRSFTMNNNLSVAGNSPPTGLPLVNYAFSQSAASASGGTSAQADTNGTILVGSNPGARVGADVVSHGAITGANVRANASIQMYGLSTLNDTHVLFGTASAVTCCAADGVAQTTVALSASGRYVRSLKVQRTDTIPGAQNNTVDFMIVSSQLPIVDPTAITAITAVAVQPHL